MNFCEYEIINEKDEINLFIKKEDLISTLMFLRDNPSLIWNRLLTLPQLIIQVVKKGFS